LIEKRLIDFKNLSAAEAKLFRLKKLDESIAINQFDRWNAVSTGFPLGIWAEISSCYQDAFISTTKHRVAKITDLRPTHSALITLALKNYFERDKRVETQDALTINTPVVASTRYLDSLKTALVKQPFTKTFKSSRGKRLKHCQQIILFCPFRRC